MLYGTALQMARLADQDTGASRAKMRRLMKEVADMQPGGRMALPMLSAAAIFVRQDENRTDKMRAVITGPQVGSVGSPRSGQAGHLGLPASVEALRFLLCPGSCEL